MPTFGTTGTTAAAEEKRSNQVQTAQPAQNTQPEQIQPIQTAQPIPTPTDNVQITTPAASPITPVQTGGQTSAYDRTMQALRDQSQSNVFTSEYDSAINDAYNKIIGREPFKYDVASDPLYQQYRESYTQQGKQAMKDSMGQTASLTGGYGNSYGSRVGQETYDAYMQRLTDIIPSLRSQARNEYDAAGDALARQYSMASDMRNTEYGQFRDALGDKQREDTLALERAAQLAQAGDFSGYNGLDGYTEDQIDSMRNAWNIQNPDLAYKLGNITAKKYHSITGKYPAGYKKPSSGGGGGYYEGGGNDSGNDNGNGGPKYTEDQLKNAYLDQIHAGNHDNARTIAEEAVKQGYAEYATPDNPTFSPLNWK